MTLVPNARTLSDAADRRCAVETFDRNLVVTAGAGTGKTTLLVDRIIHLLLRNPDPVAITQIVALTFTNKAANEMKERLREKLRAYIDTDLENNADEIRNTDRREVENLLGRYQLSKDELDSRANEALRNIERADIGTIHSFASSLLRLYPLEGGVDPQFREDDGKAFDRIFERDWEIWLDDELSLASSNAEAWREILKKLKLEQLKTLARSLAAESVELDNTEASEAQMIPMRGWLEGLLQAGTEVLGRHPEGRVNEGLIRAGAEIISAFLESNVLPAERDPNAIYVGERNVNKNVKGWSKADLETAQSVVRAAKALCRMDPVLVNLLRAVLIPFAHHFRENFVAEGFVSFDGLLIRARNLVRDHVNIRAELKRRYLAILIDEFQDTDPVQYEILLYLAEAPGNSARDWRKVKLSPGKIFVVGDPKQSIYAFRRADIEAYLEVVENVIKAQDGMECRLTTNFRSTAPIVGIVNAVFQSLMKPDPGVQPPYIEIHPSGDEPTSNVSESLPPVLIRKILSRSDEMNAEKARRLEGESLAAWLEHEILGRVSLAGARGRRALAQPKDVALLFRKLTDVHDYLEPLRRRGIRYVIEGERHFYRAREIVDAVNLFRAIDNPHDRLALVGVLRSPLGAASDQVIYDLHTRNLLDYRDSERLTRYNFPPTIAELYRALARLNTSCRTLPVGEAVSEIFATLPLTLLAASSFHSEQAVANLEKLHQQAEMLGREDASMTFKQTIRQLEQRVLEVNDEAESVLAEENVDAVRILSIHKSKGLEFPIIVLAGCHSGSDDRQQRAAEALFDWSSGLTGYRVGPFRDLPAIYIAEKNLVRGEAEEKRLLYVAMTRAREHLIISCGPQARKTAGSFASMLDEACDGQLSGVSQSQELAVGTINLRVEVVQEALSAPASEKRKTPGSTPRRDWEPYLQSWSRRHVAYEHAMNHPRFITPTLLKRQEHELSESSYERTPVRGTTLSPLLIGDLAHRLLQTWDFRESIESCRGRIAALVDASFPAESTAERRNTKYELYRIFEAFWGSQIYRELADANILGREVPLLMPWGGRVMEGVIDLIYEKHGLLYLSDFKTDRTSHADAARAAEQYRVQADVYCRAAEQSLGKPVTEFKVIFLRIGEAVALKMRSDDLDSADAR